MAPDCGQWPRVWCRMMRSVLHVMCFLDILLMLHSKLISETDIGKVAPITLFPMGNWKKCRFDFQTCFHSKQDYLETVKDISKEKVRHLENSILHNPPVPKLAPPPPGGHKKIERKCARLMPLTVFLCLKFAWQYILPTSMKEHPRYSSVAYDH